MYIVAVLAQSGEDELLADRLATALGLSSYEARQRSHGHGGGPLIAATFAHPEQAMACAAALQRNGLSVINLSSREIVHDDDRLQVRSFRLQADRLEVTTRHDECLDVPYAEVRLLLHGSVTVQAAAVHEPKTEEKNKRFLSIPGRRMAAGDYAFAPEEDRRGFLHLYAGGRPTVAFHQEEVDYGGLCELRQFSSADNFAAVNAELRQRCANAIYDMRLLTRPAQARILGPLFRADKDLDIAIALVVRAAGVGACCSVL